MMHVTATASGNSQAQNPQNSQFCFNPVTTFINSNFAQAQTMNQAYMRQINNSSTTPLTYKQQTSKLGIYDHEEVKETSNESSSEHVQNDHNNISSSIPHYPDYVMSDPEQKQKMMQQIMRIKENIKEVREQVE